MSDWYLRLKKYYSQLMFKFFPAYRLRKSGAKVGQNVFFGDQVYVELENARYLTIEDGVVLSAFTKVILHDSSLNRTTGGEIQYGKVLLKKNCYLGANSLILPGTIIGVNSIIGANSLVKGNYKDGCVYAGVPAKYLYTIGQLADKRKKSAKFEN